jgi:cold shock protein
MDQRILVNGQYDVVESNTMSERETGAVKWFSNKKGYGFIARDAGGDDVFVHFRSIEGDGYRSLKDGQRVEYCVVPGKNGMQAEEVKPLSE